MKAPSTEDQKRIQNRYNEYLKYSGLAIQMILIIGGGTYGGFRLDKYLGWKIPVFTLLLSMLSVGLAIWYAVKDFLKK